MPHVALTDVAKAFDGVRAVDGVSFSIDRGEVVGFLGPNGAGKTTTMRLITQFLEPDEGRIEIDGVTLGEQPAELRRRIGYLPETNPLYTDMLVGEYLDFMGRLRGMSREQIRGRTDVVVGQTGIEEVYFRPIEQLSKGYRQRVGLAQAILAEPEILILDEPTEGLDPNQRVEIRHLITRLGEERTVLLSTHVMQEVQRTCGRVLIINRGKIIADGTVEALVASGRRGTRVRVELEAPEAAAREALASLEGVADVEAGERGPEGDRPAAARAAFSITGDGRADPRRAIFELAAARGWPLWELHLERGSLEDLFRELTVEAGPPASSPAGAVGGEPSGAAEGIE
ncbi:MAG: ATP-binding cassette domain-containing protein [Gemmatimonadota bacterium]